MKTYGGSDAYLHPFLNLGIRLRRAVNSTPHTFYPPGKEPLVPTGHGPKAGLEAVKREKCHLQKSNPDSPVAYPVIQSLYRLSYPWSPTSVDEISRKVSGSIPDEVIGFFN
jgi:hypothetical protein